LEPGTGAFATTMNLAIVLVVAAAFALVIILGSAAKRTLLSLRPDAAVTTVRPIDLEAFRNLTDPAEDAHLRRRLPPSLFRSVRRARLRAMAAYIQVVASNAAVLVRQGQAVLAAGDSRYAAAAHTLVNDALLLRRNATVALLRIYVALAWSGSGVPAARVVDGYESLTGAAMLLGRLQNPAIPVQLSTRF
jgi:hypothetical protein